MKLGYSPDELFIEDQINNVYKDLSNTMKNPSHELFKNVPRARRMQKLDTELIKYFRDAKDDISTAARVAVRMLIEDEYVYPGAEEEAYKMLVIYLKTAEDKNCPADEDGLIAEELESVTNALGASHSADAKASKLRSLSLSIKSIVTQTSERSFSAPEEHGKGKPQRRSSARV